MMGTFAAALAKRRIATPEKWYRADVRGDIEDVDGVLKITHIHVHYTLKLPPDKRPEAQECLESYITSCPAAQSVVGCIDIAHTLQMMDI